MNKVLVTIFVPLISEQYDVWLPLNKKIYNIIILLLKGINELNIQYYQMSKIPILYNKETGVYYDLNSKLQDTDIKNGTELILI